MSKLTLPAPPRLPAVPLIRASEIQPFIAWLESERIPKQGFLERAGVPGDPGEDPHQFVGGLQFCEFLADVARREAGPEFGWRVGAATDATALDALIRVLPGANSLGQAIRLFCRELRWDSPTADFGLCEVEAGAWFWRRPGPGVARLLMEQYVTMMMVQIVRVAAGPSWSPTFVRLMMRCIDPVARKMLGDPEVELGAPFTAVYLTPAVLGLPTPLPACPTTTSRPGPEPASDLVDALRLALPGTLPLSPGVDWGAEAAGMSRRTFQRRLAGHGLTWSELLEEVRRETAYREIRDADLAVHTVGRRVGYRDPANFTRAFRRWTGSTPQAFRDSAWALGKVPDI